MRNIILGLGVLLLGLTILDASKTQANIEDGLTVTASEEMRTDASPSIVDVAE